MTNKEFSVKSLCLVSKGESGFFLARLADIVGKNKLVAFSQDEHEAKNFSNRNLWFMTDQYLPVGISVGSVGIWNLTSIPNINVATKDYIKTSYSSADTPIEIHCLNEANTCLEIINKLKTGIVFKPICKKIFFCYSPKRGLLQGILVSLDNLNIRNNLTYLITTDLTSLPVYLINESLYNFLSFKQIPNRWFHNSLDLGKETDRILVKSEMDIIREIIIKRASWPIMKQKGISKNDWKFYKEFINVISDNDFYEEIANNLYCKEKTAKAKVDEFISKCENFVNGQDFDTEVIASIIKRHSELNTICMKQAANFWEKEHQDKVKEAKDELQNIKIQASEIRLKAFEKAEKEIEQEKEKNKKEEKRIQNLLNEANKKEQEIRNKEEEYRKKLVEYQKDEDRIKNEISEAKKSLEIIKLECSEKSKIGDEVKNKIANKIQEAKKDISSFMSEYTFFSEIISKQLNTLANHTISQYSIKKSELYEEEIANYNELIEYLKENLLNAGVDENLSKGFAIFLFVLLKNTNALLLSGPNSEAIANAISHTCFGDELEILNCFGDFNWQSFEELKKSDKKLILVKNPFCHSWLENIIDLINQNERTYILSCSFSDDLLLESKNLYNYIVPVFTELFIDNIPENVCFSCKKKSDYKDYENIIRKPLYLSLFKEFGMSKITTTVYQSIMTDLHNIYGTNDVIPEYMYLLVPYAFATNNNKLLADKINCESRLPNDIKANLLRFLGINNE